MNVNEQDRALDRQHVQNLEARLSMMSSLIASRDNEIAVLRDELRESHAMAARCVKLLSDNVALSSPPPVLIRTADMPPPDWLNRRAEVEQVLLDCANGKREVLSMAECRDLAMRLGTPTAMEGFGRR